MSVFHFRDTQMQKNKKTPMSIISPSAFMN